MSSKLNDINDLYFTSPITQATIALATNVTGPGNDLSTCNNNCFGIQKVDSVAGTSVTYSGKFQEATTATGTFSDIPGATFPGITSTTGVNITNLVSFQRTLQFVRYVGTIGGTTSTIVLDVLLGGQKIQV